MGVVLSLLTVADRCCVMLLLDAVVVACCCLSLLLCDVCYCVLLMFVVKGIVCR